MVIAKILALCAPILYERKQLDNVLLTSGCAVGEYNKKKDVAGY